jgi:ATP-dependent RNA helicase DeaD
MLFEKEADGKERIGKSLNEAKRLLNNAQNSKGNDRDRRRGRRGNNFRGSRSGGRRRR